MKLVEDEHRRFMAMRASVPRGNTLIVLHSDAMNTVSRHWSGQAPTREEWFTKKMHAHGVTATRHVDGRFELKRFSSLPPGV